MPSAPIRYQVFISSTFKDLEPERAAVLTTILKMKNIPAGMELFVASQRTPWQVIQQVIDLSDYYVLVIAGMYGSVGEDGISYTEKEYDYAVEKNKFVIPLLHEYPEQLPAEKFELDESKRKKLESFIAKVKKHTVTTWRGADDLAGKVALALIEAIGQSPAVGWVRADAVDNTEVLKKNSALHEENERLKVENRRLQGIVRLPLGASPSDVSAMADRPNASAVSWFLNFSKGGRRSTVGSIPRDAKPFLDELAGRMFVYVDDQTAMVAITQRGWLLRDELLCRAYLMYMFDRTMKPPFPSVGGATNEEAETIVQQLIQRRLAYFADQLTGYRLTADGKVAAQRFQKMQH